MTLQGYPHSCAHSQSYDNSPAAIFQAEEKAAERIEREATEVYAAIRPDGTEAAWLAPIPELRPTLRPYQSRALAWMVQRERGAQVPHTSWKIWPECCTTCCHVLADG